MATKLLSATPIGTAVGTHIAPPSAAQSKTSTVLETRLLAVDGGQIAYDDTGGSGLVRLISNNLQGGDFEYSDHPPLIRGSLRLAGAAGPDPGKPAAPSGR
jgi:hypothetical protein